MLGSKEDAKTCYLVHTIAQHSCAHVYNRQQIRLFLLVPAHHETSPSNDSPPVHDLQKDTLKGRSYAPARSYTNTRSSDWRYTLPSLREDSQQTDQAHCSKAISSANTTAWNSARSDTSLYCTLQDSYARPALAEARPLLCLPFCDALQIWLKSLPRLHEAEARMG